MSSKITPVGNGRLALFVLIALCVLFVVGYANRLMTLSQLDEATHEMEAQIQADNDKNLELQARLAYVKSPDYLDKIAREDLGMAKEGDTVVVVLAATPVPTFALPTVTPQANVVAPAPLGAWQGEAGADSDGKPLWQQWFELFAAAPCEARP